MNFYLHYLGDYDRDTKGLSLLEHGAYRVLLDHVLRDRADAPNDLRKLYRIAGSYDARGAQGRRGRRSVLPINGDGRRHNKRAEEEIQKPSEGKEREGQGLS
jgi:uncharacterized protein YdaU (DUF1376 family)